MAITASATPRRERSKSPEPKVTFQDPPMEEGNRQTGPNQGRPNYGYQSQSREGYRGFSQSRGRGRGYMLLQNMRGNGRGGFHGNYRGRGGFPPQQSYNPNRAICHHRDFLSMDSTHHRLNPRQPCLEGWRQIKNVENVALRSTLMSSTVRGKCAVSVLWQGRPLQEMLSCCKTRMTCLRKDYPGSPQENLCYEHGPTITSICCYAC